MANKKRKKIPEASKHRLMVLGFLSLLAVAYFIYTVYNCTYKIISLTNEEKELNLKLDNLKTEADYLKIEIEKLKDPEELAKYAREKYLYSKDGEIVIKIDKAKELEEKQQEIQKTENDIKNIEDITVKYKYAIIIGSGLLALVITVITIKSKLS